MRYPSKESREIALLAQTIGWEFSGITRGNHIRLHHPNGSTYILSGTASDWRSRANALSTLQRLAGTKIGQQGGKRAG